MMASLSGYAHWCNSGISVIGVTNHFFLWMSGPVYNINPITCQEPVTSQGTGPSGEPATVILLNGHNIKLAPNDLPLYT